MKIIGDGGHAAVIRELIAANPIERAVNDGVFVVAVGDNAARKREVLSRSGEPLILWSLIHPFSWVSPSASIGCGTVVMAGAVIQAGASIGTYCIINTGATVDHGCTIGNYAHIAPGAHLCGNVTVGEGALVGVGVGIAPGAKIPAWSLVKARRLEIETLPDNG